MFNLFYKNPILFYSSLLFLILYISTIYVYLFPFEHTIIIKSKSSYASGRVLYNTVSDSEDQVYQIANAWPLLHFKSAEVFMKLEEGVRFKIRGYGIRIGILGLFPNIVSAVPI